MNDVFSDVRAIDTVYGGHLAHRRWRDVPTCGINMPEVVRWIHYHRFNESDWSKGKLLYTRVCCMAAVLPRHGGKLLFQCCAVKSTSLVHRAPTTTLRQSTLMARHIVARGPGEGVFFLYKRAKRIDFRLRAKFRNRPCPSNFLSRSSDPELRIALRIDCIYRLTLPGCSFVCMYLVRLSFTKK